MGLHREQRAVRGELVRITLVAARSARQPRQPRRPWRRRGRRLLHAGHDWCARGHRRCGYGGLTDDVPASGGRGDRGGRVRRPLRPHRGAVGAVADADADAGTDADADADGRGGVGRHERRVGACSGAGPRLCRVGAVCAASRGVRCCGTPGSRAAVLSCPATAATAKATTAAVVSAATTTVAASYCSHAVERAFAPTFTRIDTNSVDSVVTSVCADATTAAATTATTAKLQL